MKLLSVDVGIKNLSFCLFDCDESKEKDIKDINDKIRILKWDNIDLSEKNALTCSEFDKNGLVCGKPGLYCITNKSFCLKCSKKQPYLRLAPDLKPAFINKQKLQTLLEIAKKYNIRRFQFNFGGYFDLLGLKSRDNREAHSFSMGKELMLLQLAKEFSFEFPHFIHDRGIATVLAWGLYENRITKEDMINQINYIEKNNLLDGISIIRIKGENPNQKDRDKDQWDFADSNNGEAECFEIVFAELESRNISSVFTVNNTFDPAGLKEIDNLFNFINTKE